MRAPEREPDAQSILYPLSHTCAAKHTHTHTPSRGEGREMDSGRDVWAPSFGELARSLARSRFPAFITLAYGRDVSAASAVTDADSHSGREMVGYLVSTRPDYSFLP